MREQKVNILGTEWTLKEVKGSEDTLLGENDGYCDSSVRQCVIDDMTENCDMNSKKNLVEYGKTVKRHELIHAFLHESGLSNCSWAVNEEMVDWFAIQSPKIFEVFKELDIL